MYAPAGVKTSTEFPIPDSMKAWVLGDPGQLTHHRQAGAGAEAGGSAGAYRRGGDLRHRSGSHLSGPAGHDPRRPAVQQELHAGPRIYGHGGGARPRRRRIQDRPARRGRNSRRLRPVQALPRGHVHLLSQLRPQLRRRRQGPPRQRFHHRRRLLRIPGQQHQYAGRDCGRHVGRGRRARRHRRHGDVCADRTRRPGGRRKRRRQRRGPDRPDGGRGGEGARRQPGDPHRNARQPAQDRRSNSAPTPWSISARSRTSSPR